MNRFPVVMVVLVMLFSAVGGGSAYWWWSQQSPQSSTLPVNTRLGGDFTLPSTLGRAASLGELRGQVILLNFGFTFCPDVCPTVLALMSGVEETLREEGQLQQGDMTLVFISFDGERDTVSRLQQYLPFFSKSLLGFTGSSDEIAVVAQQYGVVYLKEELEGGSYSFSHSDYIYLLDKQGRIRKLFATDTSLDEMMRDTQQLLGEAQ